MNSQIAKRGDLVRIENRCERCAVVLRFPDAAHRVAEVDGRRVTLRNFNVVNAAAHAGRSDVSESEALEERVARLIDHRRGGRCDRAAVLRFEGRWY